MNKIWIKMHLRFFQEGSVGIVTLKALKPTGSAETLGEKETDNTEKHTHMYKFKARTCWSKKKKHSCFFHFRIRAGQGLNKDKEKEFVCTPIITGRCQRYTDDVREGGTLLVLLVVQKVQGTVRRWVCLGTRIQQGLFSLYVSSPS